MYKSILIPINIGSIDFYEEIFAIAKTLSNSDVTILHLIYVDEYVNVFGYDYAYVPLRSEPSNDLIVSLDQFADKIDHPRDKIKTVVRNGSVLKEVLNYSDKAEADLIIIGRGKPTWTSLFIGSLAVNLAQESKAPVLIIPS